MAIKFSRDSVVTWIAALILVGGGAYWYWSTPSEEARHREQECRNWGYTDAESLARCRASEREATAVIEPKFRQAAMRAVSTFNKQVAGLATNKTVAQEADYTPASIRDVSKALGGIAAIILPKGHFPLEGRRFKVLGRIITETPDPSDSSGDTDSDNDPPAWQPRTYQLWGPFPKAKNAMPDTVQLDIESLNRSERQFIQNHCEMVSLTECNAVIWGHAGRISEGDNSGIQYRGLVVDQVEIQAIDVKSYKVP